MLFEFDKFLASDYPELRNFLKSELEISFREARDFLDHLNVNLKFDPQDIYTTAGKVEKLQQVLTELTQKKYIVKSKNLNRIPQLDSTSLSLERF